MGARIVRLALALALLACNTLLPPGTPSPAPPTSASTPIPFRPTVTPAPTATLGPTFTATPFSTPSTFTESGVRVCAYQPGVSVPAQMPVEVIAAPTPIPLRLPAPPANSTVSQEITDRQLRIYRDLWNTVNTEYLYPDFNGRDWNAIGAEYEQLIRAGLTDEDFYLAMELMLSELGDEHSSFHSPQSAAEKEAAAAGQNDYVGIGVLWMPVPEAGRGVILLAFPGSPAAEAGLGAHDAILAVNGEPALHDNGDLRDAIRGPEGTAVTLTVQHVGGQPFELTLVRRRIRGALPIDDCLIPGTRIGYLFLPSLADETIPDQMREALQALTADGPLEGLVLDNRQNGGGTLSVLKPILSFFTSGTVGYFVSHDDRRPLNVTPEDIGGSQAVPLVVLVDVDTASFGEVLSGLLQASGRAQVVGQTTLGNVEILLEYRFEGGSRAWIAHETFEPAAQPDANWEQTGIVPDVHAPTRWDLFSEATDPALAVAVELLSEP